MHREPPGSHSQVACREARGPSDATIRINCCAAILQQFLIKPLKFNRLTKILTNKKPARKRAFQNIVQRAISAASLHQLRSAAGHRLALGHNSKTTRHFGIGFDQIAKIAAE